VCLEVGLFSPHSINYIVIFIVRWIIYILFAGLVTHGLVFLSGTICIGLFKKLAYPKLSIGKILKKLGLFLLILLFVSGFFNAVWGTFVWGSMYETFGADTDDDYCPFFPPTEASIYDEHGHLISSIAMIQLIWLIFTALALALSCLLYIVLYKKWFNHAGEVPNATVK
jgi:hypothetical protein